MKLGIWFEPEMINEDTNLYREHPDFMIRVPGRKGVKGREQYVLDFTRKDVRDYIKAMVVNILKNANISYVKWDMNLMQTVWENSTTGMYWDFMSFWMS